MAIYSLDKKACKRSGAPVGQRARYMLRLGKYKHSHSPDERLEASFSGNMPAWAATDPLIYWDATDLHERRNARLADLYIIALPRELLPEQRLELAKAFCAQECQSMPYTATIHDGGGRNPHLHLLRSRRINDGHNRDPQLWFARAATGKKRSEEGGARKFTGDRFESLVDRHRSIFETRVRWQDICNHHLGKAGLNARIDCRTLEEIKKAPVTDIAKPVPRPEIRRGKKHSGVHRGHWGTKQHRHEELARQNSEALRRLQAYEADIAELEAMAAELEAEASRQERIEALHAQVAEQRRAFLAAAAAEAPAIDDALDLDDQDEGEMQAPPLDDPEDEDDDEDECMRLGR